jgi:hypothetical protein
VSSRSSSKNCRCFGSRFSGSVMRWLQVSHRFPGTRIVAPLVRTGVRTDPEAPYPRRGWDTRTPPARIDRERRHGSPVNGSEVVGERSEQGLTGGWWSCGLLAGFWWWRNLAVSIGKFLWEPKACRCGSCGPHGRLGKKFPRYRFGNYRFVDFIGGGSC